MPHGLRIDLPIIKRADSVRADGTVTLKLFGFGSMSAENGLLLVDHHRDIVEPNELETTAYEFVKEARQLDVDHDRNPIGDLIESMFLSPEKAVAMGVVDPKERHGWWTGFEVTDAATIERVKSGELSMMSVDIVAMRNVLAADQTAERITKAKKRDDGSTPDIGRLRQIRTKFLSLVGEGANQGAHVCLWKRREPSNPTPEKDTTIMPIATPAKKAADTALADIMDALKGKPELQAALTSMLAAVAPKPAEPPAPAPEKKPEEAPEGAETPAAKAYRKALDEQAVEIQKLRDAQKRSEEREGIAVEVSKARKAGLEYVPGKTIEEVGEEIYRAKQISAEAGSKHEKWLKSIAETVKSSGIFREHGLPPAGDTENATFEQLYEAEKSKRPKDDPTAIASELAKKHPDLYRARGKS